MTMMTALMGPIASAPKAQASLAPLMERKQAIAAALAQQVAYSSQREDTTHPAFKGCVDWHSSVHGVWALVAYQRATGDRQYAPLVSSILNKPALIREEQHLRRAPAFEMPYGRAWLLRLAIDHHHLTGSNDLVAFGDEVAISLLDYYRGHAIDRFSGAYQSASWALINLLDYARHRRLAELETEVVGWVTTSFVDVAPKCTGDGERGGFMAVSTNWAALVARVLDQDDYAKWLDTFIATNGLPTPLTDRNSDHEFGLDFSRAWGLWDMYAKTGRAEVLKAYVDHFNNGLVPASNWRGSYMVVGHWVAQFGMFALQPLFGPERGR
jgi:Protein of unknown function (DUF2891)